MKVVIEFYRTRIADDAHAVIGRETVDAADLDAAIEIARLLGKDAEHAPVAGCRRHHRLRRRDDLFQHHRRPGGHRQRADMLSADDPRADVARDALARPGEEYAGGARVCGFGDHQYGRRVEADRSWTVYHVFTGIPAHVNGASLIGLSCSEATKSMLSLNFCSSERRKERIAARLFAALEKPADQS